MMQHPVPEKLLARIGDVTVSFALLESVIQTFVGSLIAEHQRVGQIITVEVSFRNLRALAMSLYKERHGEDADYEALKTLMRRASQLEDKRNQITHSVWGAGRTIDTITRVKATAKEKKGLHFEFESLGENELVQIASDLKQLAQDVQQFWILLLKAGKAINNPTQKFWP